MEMIMSKNKNAGALIRVSTAKQLDGTSPEKQLEAIQRLAHEQGFVINEKHIWMLAESGFSREREGFREAINASANHEISRVYVYNIDRLGRNLLEMLLFLRELDDHEIDCWGAEKKDLLRGDDFILQIQGAVASKERQEILKRTQDGLIRAVKNGKYSGGIIAYGYKLNPDTKMLEIAEKEAEVVRQMFSWCVDEKLSCPKIADRLNSLDVPTRYQIDNRKMRSKGKREKTHTAGIWRAGRVLNMLRNPAYMGKWEYGTRSSKRKPEDRIKGYSPAIVSEQVFARADKVLKNNNRFAKRNSRRKYLLRSLIKCGECGRMYCGSFSRVGPSRSQEKTYYRCNGNAQYRKLGVPKCTSQSIIGLDVENVVWADIKNFCKNPQVAVAQLRNLRKPSDDNLDERISEIDAQLRNLEKEEANLIRIAAKSSEVNMDRLDSLLSENHRSRDALFELKSSLQANKLRASTLETELLEVAEWLSRLEKRIESATYDEKRQAVEALVKEIVVTSETRDGKKFPVVKIVYRFDETLSRDGNLNTGVITNHTGMDSLLQSIEN